MGTAGILSFLMTVPGGAALPCAGVTRVTVQSTHRRRGLLTAMMRRQLSDIHERGEPLAALYASEAPIYGRFGYGLATYQALIDIDGTRSAFRNPIAAGGQMLMVDVPSAVESFTAVCEEARPQQPGMIAMDEWWWRMVLADPEGERGGASPFYRVVYRTPDGPDGFALYRIKMSWSPSEEPSGEVQLHFLLARTPAAYAALWRYLLDIDLTTRVSAPMRSPEEPLRFLLADSRQPSLRVFDGLWLRLIDVPKALQSRRYASDGRLLLRVHDDVCPWNDGLYELSNNGDAASCVPTDTAADLELEVADLATLYLGGTRIGVLHRSGRIQEHRPGAVALATAMFATDVAPWCPTHF